MTKAWDQARAAQYRGASTYRRERKSPGEVGDYRNNLLSSYGATHDKEKLHLGTSPVSRYGDMSCVCGMRVCGCHDFVTWSDGTKHRCVCAGRGAQVYALETHCTGHEHVQHPERFPDTFCAEHKQWKHKGACPQCAPNCVDCAHPVTGSGDKCFFCRVKLPNGEGLVLDGLFHSYHGIQCIESIYVALGKAGLTRVGDHKWILCANPNEMADVKRRLGFPLTNEKPISELLPACYDGYDPGMIDLPAVPTAGSPAPTYDNICEAMRRIAESGERIPTEAHMSAAMYSDIKRYFAVTAPSAFTLGTTVGNIRVVLDESVKGWELR